MAGSSNFLGINTGTDAERSGITQPGGISYVLAYITDTGRLWFFDGVTEGGIEIALKSDAPSGANPTATAGATAIDGSASTFMRSDAAPEVQTATDSTLGLVKPDGTVITVSGGAITVPDATTGNLGVVKPDGSSITISSGTISAPYELVPQFPAQTANFNAAAGALYHVDTTSGAITATLPASPNAGNTVGFVDSSLAGAFASHSLTIALNGQKYQNATANLVMSIGYGMLKIQFNGTQWVQVP